MSETVPKNWHGLMEILDDIYPEEIIPTFPDRKDRDPGPRIVSLCRRLDAANKKLERVADLADKWEYGALRWADPLPVPPEVALIREAIA